MAFAFQVLIENMKIARLSNCGSSALISSVCVCVLEMAASVLKSCHLSSIMMSVISQAVNVAS